MRNNDLIKLSINNDNKITGVANSLTRSINGVKLDADYSAKLSNKTVPLLFAHDWQSMPVGSATIQDVSKDGLSFNGALFESSDKYDQIKECIQNGVLSVSVGLYGGSKNANNEITNFNLMELSLTPTPADSKSDVTFQSLAFPDIKYVRNGNNENKEDLTMKKTLQQTTDDDKKNNTNPTPADGAQDDTTKTDDDFNTSLLEVLSNINDSLSTIGDNIEALDGDSTDDDKKDTKTKTKTNDDTQDNDTTEQQLKDKEAIELSLKKDVRDIIMRTGNIADVYNFVK